MFDNKRPVLIPLFIVCLAIIFLGCDTEPTEVEDYQSEPVLQAYLTTGEPFDKIYLEWVFKDIGSYYDPNQHGVVGAAVKIFTVFNDETGDSILPGDPDYLEVQYRNYDTDGAYYPVDYNGELVQPNIRYRLEAYKPNQIDIWAETTAPDTFTIRVTNHELLDQIIQSGETPVHPEILPNNLPCFHREMPFIKVKWSDAWKGGDAFLGGCVLSITALTDTTDLAYLDPDWDPNDPDTAIIPEDEQRTNWTIAPSYQDSVNVVWIYFEWIGPHRLDVVAGSFEYYRYMFSIIQYLERPESYVHGGLGCFGATAVHSFYINMIKVDPKIYTPKVPVNYASHDFGQVTVNTQSEIWTMRIFNMGAENLNLYSFYFPDDEFSLLPQVTFPDTILSAEYHDFPIVYEPTVTLRDSTTLLIYCNDPVESVKKIPLRGEGIL